MMRVVLLLSALVAVALAAPEEKYTTKYDNINLDSILSNERLYKNYIECLLGKGPCTPEAAELKSVLPDALKNECSKCSDKQKEGSHKVIKHLIEKKRGDFDKLEEKYDPEGTYSKKYAEDAKKHNIKLPA